MITRIYILLLIVSHASLCTFAQNTLSGELILLDSISSKKDDSAPIIFSKNKTLLYSSINTQGDKDVKVGIWNGNGWTPGYNVYQNINNRFDNEIFHIDSEGGIYFQKAILDPAGRAIFGIFHSSFQSGRLDQAVKQNIKYFNNKSKDQSFCLSQNENIMILSIQSYFSYGVEDLYVSFRNGKDSWTEPKNIGSTINTKFEEFTPFLDEDNRTLYFSSNGHPNGMGSKDIWVSYRLDSTWTNWTLPVNLGPEINTFGMETSFRKTGLKEIPYLVVSSRTSDGQSDIFGLRNINKTIDSILSKIRPEEIVTDPVKKDSLTTFLKVDTANSASFIDSLSPNENDIPLLDSNHNILTVHVINKGTKNSIPARIIFESKEKSDTVFLPKDSLLNLSLLWLDTVDLLVESRNYFTQTKRIIFENKHFGLKLQEEIELDSLEIGKTIKFDHVLFKRGTAELLSESYTDLNYVSNFLIQNPILGIEIAGHTDNSGNAYLNYILSEKRAKAIKNYIVDQGVAGERIITKGYGGSKPIASNDKEETMRLNRRVEFRLIEQQK